VRKRKREKVSFELSRGEMDLKSYLLEAVDGVHGLLAGVVQRG